MEGHGGTWRDTEKAPRLQVPGENLDLNLVSRFQRAPPSSPINFSSAARRGHTGGVNRARSKWNYAHLELIPRLLPLSTTSQVAHPTSPGRPPPGASPEDELGSTAEGREPGREVSTRRARCPGFTDARTPLLGGLKKKKKNTSPNVSALPALCRPQCRKCQRGDMRANMRET